MSTTPTAAQKLHPLSIPYRILQTAPSVVVLGGFLVFAVGQSEPWLSVPMGALVVVLGLGTVVAWQVAYYQRFRYELTDDTFDIRSGVISRRNREIPYRRVQNVDIARSLVQRAMGIADLRIETAGGGGQSEAHLRYVGYDEAKRLQEEIRARTRGVETSERDPGPKTGTRGRDLYRISDRDLGVLAIASFDLRVASILLLVLSFVAPSLLIDLLFAAPVAPVVIILAVALVVALASAILSGTSAIVNNYGFILSQVGDELRYERGLLQRYDGSIPLDKLQTMVVSENWLMRRLGYGSLTVETAGYAPGQGAAESASAVPISTLENAVGIAKRIEDYGEPSFTRPASQARIRYAWQYTLLTTGLLIAAYVVNWWTASAYAWWVVAGLYPILPLAAHYKWTHRGVSVQDRHVVIRSGFWRRQTQVVPFYRIQTIDAVQSVLQGRWGIASVVVDTAASSGVISGQPTVYDLPEEMAWALQEDLSVELQNRLLARKRRDRLREIARPRTYQGVRGAW